MDDNTRKYIAKYVEDLHSLVAHGVQPISRQVDEARKANGYAATDLLTRMVQVLQNHERQLDERMHTLGTSPTTAVQDAAAAMAGVVAGFYNQVRTEALAKSLRDDYTFLSHCSVSWLMLMTTARSLGDHDTEELAEQGYRDSARLVIEIDRTLPEVVIAEMKKNGLPAQDVTEWTSRIVHGAWNRDPVPSGAA